MAHGVGGGYGLLAGSGSSVPNCRGFGTRFRFLPWSVDLDGRGYYVVLHQTNRDFAGPSKRRSVELHDVNGRRNGSVER